ncbi:Chloride channel, partial [Globisporangium splendens]
MSRAERPAPKGRRAYPMQISFVEEAIESPRIGEEDGEWRWGATPRGRGSSSSSTRRSSITSPMLPLAVNTSSTTTPTALKGMPRLRRSMSPRPRADSVMEKIMNPHLDREAIDSQEQDDHQQQTMPDQQPSHYVKASAFDDETHSVYVAKYPGGLRGLFVLFQSPILLMAIGLFSGVVGLFIDFWLAKISIYHNVLSDYGFRYFLLSALLAAAFSTMLVHFVCPQAAGSGLPFMKVAISGIDMSAYLSFRCVVTKIVGLLAAFAAGLSIGKEGPFIMISCGFASILMNLPLFQRINNDETKRLEMLACACAAGVAATFGSPFGGVLFGVEVTSHFYMVRTLPRSFFAAIVGALLVNFVTENSRYGLFGSSDLGIANVTDLHNFTIRDLTVFTMIGVTCGLGGALFNYCIYMLVRARDHFFRMPIPRGTWWLQGRLGGLLFSGLGKRLALVLTITLVSCFLEFYGDSAWFIRHGSPRRILAALFSDKLPFQQQKDGKHPPPHYEEDEDESVLLSRSLITYLPLKYVLTLVSVVLPIPAGLFTPTFVIGGIYGRLIGEAINAFGLLTTQYEPFEYAIIGAGAFSSGVTHAISTAVIIMEISHNDGLNLPVSVAILASYFTAKRFSENVYDMLITTSHLPRLQKLPKAAYDIPIWEVMQDVHDTRFLTADSTYADAWHVLSTSNEPVYPIVDSHENKFLLATVTRSRLRAAVDYCHRKMNGFAPATASTSASAKAAPSTASLLFPSARKQPAANTEITPLLSSSDQGSIAEASKAAGGAFVGLGIDTAATVAEELGTMSLLDWPIHFAFRRGGKIMDWLTVLINPSPFQLMEMTPMKRVDLLFRMLKLNNAYITRSGRLMGVITRDRLMSFLGTTSKYRVPGLCNTFTTCCAKMIKPSRRNSSQSQQQHQGGNREYKKLP